jgi:hypothetical protein
MHGKSATQRFKPGDIIRYASGVSALFRYDGTHNCDRLYGEHVLGGAQGAADTMFFDLRPANLEDLAFCRAKRPDWFAQTAAEMLDALKQEPRSSAAPAEVSIAELRQMVEDAIRIFCQSLGTGSVSISSDGVERIYYAGINLKALSVAVTLALPRPQSGASYGEHPHPDLK